MSSTNDFAGGKPEPKLREVRYRHSLSFVDVLRELGATLLVSTYQAGKLGAISAGEKGLRFAFLNFDQAMGVAVSPQRLAVGAKGQIWFFESNPQLAPTLAPAGQYDACYLARSAHVTGGIHCHEMAWGAGGELWVVNSSYEALAVGTPVATQPGRYLRSRITQALYRSMTSMAGPEMRDAASRNALTAASIDAYATTAVSVATASRDSDERSWIAERSGRLFENYADIRDLAECLMTLKPLTQSESLK